MNMYVIKDQLDHFEETFAQIIQSSLSKRPESDPIQLSRIRIHNTVFYNRKPYLSCSERSRYEFANHRVGMQNLNCEGGTRTAGFQPIGRLTSGLKRFHLDQCHVTLMVTIRLKKKRKMHLCSLNGTVTRKQS